MDYMFNVVVKRPHGKPCEMMYVQADGLDEALRLLNQKIKDFGLEVEEIKSNYFENGLSRVMYSHGGARDGAGRKAVAPEKKRKTFLSVAATAEQAEKIRADARLAGKTVSAYLLELALNAGSSK